MTRRIPPEALGPHARAQIEAALKSAPGSTVIGRTGNGALTNKRPNSRNENVKSELSLHKDVAQFLAIALSPDAFWTTFPAGGGGKIRGAVLKSCGLKDGVPDILIIYNGLIFWIELKNKRGHVSDAQKKCHNHLYSAGSQVAVCRSIEDVAKALVLFGVPVRAEVR